MPLNVVEANKPIRGMSINSQDELPLLVINNCNDIALLVRWDQRHMSNDEADAIILSGKFISYVTNEFISKLNLGYWIPYDKSITISNKKKWQIELLQKKFQIS